MTECFLHLSPLLSGHEFEQTPGDSKGQGSLAAAQVVAKSGIQLSN